MSSNKKGKQARGKSNKNGASAAADESPMESPTTSDLQPTLESSEEVEVDQTVPVSSNSREEATEERSKNAFESSPDTSKAVSTEKSSHPDKVSASSSASGEPASKQSEEKPKENPKPKSEDRPEARTETKETKQESADRPAKLEHKDADEVKVAPIDPEAPASESSKEQVPVPPSAMSAAAPDPQAEAKSNAALEAAKSLASNTAFLQRATVYQSAKTEGILALQSWHEKLLNFFSQQRAPYVQKLDTVQIRIRNGDRALSEAKRILTFLAEIHGSYAKNLRGITLFGTPLDRIPSRQQDATGAATLATPPPPPPPPSTAVQTSHSGRGVPPPPPADGRRPSASAGGQPVPPSALSAGLIVPTTANVLGVEIPLPEGATVDPSALSLAVLAGVTYQHGDRARSIAEQLKQTVLSVTILQKSYANRAQADVETMRSLVQQCEKAAREVDSVFKTHMEIYGYYSRALSPAPVSPSSTKPQDSPSQALTSTSRKDLWRSEQVYRERVVALTKLHETFFTQCSQLLEDLSAAEQQRALKLHAIVSDSIGRFDQYFGALHRTNAVAATEVQQSLIVANRNHAILKQQQHAELAQHVSVEGKAITAPPPGPFPPNVNIVLAGPAERRTSFLKNWTPVYLVLTKDNYLYCYSGEDVDTSAEVDKLLGSQPGLPSGTLVTTSDPRQARLVLKEGRSVESNELWVADLFHSSAVIGEGRPEDESPNKAGLGFLFTLRVSPPGFFSRNWNVVLRCKTPEETQTWLRAINDHNKGISTDEPAK